MSAPLSIRHILAQLDEPFTGEALFDQLPNIVFFIKNSLGQYAAVNQTLVERCGLRRKSDLIGRTPSQVLRPPLGQSYEAQDRRVLTSGRPLLGQLELHVFPTGDVGWCLTTKLPLRSRTGGIIGLMGVSQDLRLPDSSTRDYQQLATAIEHAESNLADPPDVPRLAAMAGLSRYQLDGRMRRVFGLTTGQWLLKLRIDHAQRQLRETDRPMSQIALDAGYADQSAFARQFQRATGLTPREYRQAYAPKASL